MKTTVTTKTTTDVKVNIEPEETPTLDEKVTPKGKGKLDMVIAFDTTGSMAAYIDDVRRQVAEMIPRSRLTPSQSADAPGTRSCRR